MNQSVGDALKLEEIKLSRFAQEAGTKKSAKIKALHSDLNSGEACSIPVCATAVN